MFGVLGTNRVSPYHFQYEVDDYLDWNLLIPVERIFYYISKFISSWYQCFESIVKI